VSRTTLIECQPRLPDGTVMTLRLVDRSPRAAAYLGAQWLPHVVELPAFETAVGFDGDRFGAAPAPQIGALAFALAPEIRAAAGWVWRDAPVTIRQADWPIDGSNPADAAFAITFTATASQISVDDGVARVELIDRGQALRVPAAPMRFGASGIALLDAAAAARDRQSGTVVPVAFGRVLNLPGLLVDRVNNIWLFAAQAPGGPAATSVEAIYEGGLAFTPGTARANLAALQASAPAAGTADWCLNAAGLLLARLPDRPVYPITCDATFGSAALGDVFAGIIGGRLPIWAGEPAALDALGLGECGLYIADETSVAAALDQLLAGLGLIWKVRSDGLVRAFRLQWDTPVLRAASHQRHAPRRLRTILPAGRRQLGYATNNRVHGDGEIARILLADSLAYADGTLIEALKPAQPGADVTAANTAAAIADQAWAATNGAQEVVDNRLVPVGANAVTNSDFTRELYGFRAGTISNTGGFPVSAGINLSPDWSGQLDVLFATVNTGGAAWAAGAGAYADAVFTRGRWNGGTMADQRAFGLPCKQGDRLFARSLIARHRCDINFFLLIFDKDGELVEAPFWSGGRVGGAGGGAPSSFDAIGGSYDVTNAAAASAALMWRIQAAGAADPFLFMAQPMMGVLPPGQTALPPYTSGPYDPLADLTAESVPSLDALPGQVFQADHLGNISPGQLPRTVQATRRRGTVVVSASTSWSLEATNFTGSISAAGLLTITDVDGNGQARIISSRDGVELRTGFDVAVQRAAAPITGGGGSGTSASDSSFEQTADGLIWTDLTGDLTITTGSAGEASLGAPLEFFPNVTFPDTGGFTFGAGLRWRRQTSPGVWTVVGSEATETSVAVVERDSGMTIFTANGTITCNRTATGLGAGTSQTFRLQGRSADPTYFLGTASAVGS
jgi:hypothetical protein